jgi:hypothetical protein
MVPADCVVVVVPDEKPVVDDTTKPDGKVAVAELPIPSKFSVTGLLLDSTTCPQVHTLNPKNNPKIV